MADVNIYGTINSMAGDGKAAKAAQVFDETQGKFQSAINEELYNKSDVTMSVENEILSITLN